MVNLALLVAVGVNAEGYREVLVVEPAGGERKEAWRNLLKGLVERGLRGVRLVISDDHPSIRQAVMAELPGASWQRCVVHFMRNVLAHVPQSERGVVAEELQEVFVARRRGTAESLARGFVERYRDRFKRAVEVFAQGLEEALTYLDFPSGHQRHIKSTNVLERLIREVKRRTRVVGVFPGEGSLVNLAKGHGRLSFPALPGHGPALGRGRKTHKNRDLTGSPSGWPGWSYEIAHEGIPVR